MTLAQFQMTDGKDVFVNPKYVTGVFENTVGSQTETVINLTSGGYYRVTNSVIEVIEGLEEADSIG